MGTSNFAIPSFLKIYKTGCPILVVVTRPDRPKGRGLQISSPPIVEEAKKLNIPLLQPEKLNDIFPELNSMAPDLIVVVAYGKMLPSSILKLPRLGCINLHPSLLPKYRGAAPIEGAIIAGETETGVTITFIDEGVDSGDVVMQRRVPIGEDETGGELAERLAVDGAELLLLTIKELEKGGIIRTPQNHALHTMTSPIKSGDCLIYWEWPAQKIVNLIRALSPQVGAYTFWKGKRLKVWKAQNSSFCASYYGQPGMFMGIEKDGVMVKAGEGAVKLLEVQPENKARMDGIEFVRGMRLKEGDSFGS